MTLVSIRDKIGKPPLTDSLSGNISNACDRKLKIDEGFLPALSNDYKPKSRANHVLTRPLIIASKLAFARQTDIHQHGIIVSDMPRVS